MSEPENELLDALRALYREVDALYEGARCERSTECCRFGLTGREPQVTSIERALLLRALAARGGVPPAKTSKRRALPLRRDAERERACPLLDRTGSCLVYAARPLGCRTFHCRRAELLTPVSRRTLQEVVRRLQTLAARHAPGGDKPHALTRIL